MICKDVYTYHDNTIWEIFYTLYVKYFTKIEVMRLKYLTHIYDFYHVDFEHRH